MLVAILVRDRQEWNVPGEPSRGPLSFSPLMEHKGGEDGELPGPRHCGGSTVPLMEKQVGEVLFSVRCQSVVSLPSRPPGSQSSLNVHWGAMCISGRE